MSWLASADFHPVQGFVLDGDQGYSRLSPVHSRSVDTRPDIHLEDLVELHLAFDPLQRRGNNLSEFHSFACPLMFLS